MYLSAADTMDWPETILLLGSMMVGVFLIGIIVASLHEFRKTKLELQQKEDVRQLVRRYEQLAETTLDTQQRVAADIAELRARTASIEQILRTVE